MNEFAPVAGFGLLLVRPAMLVMVAPGLGAVYVPAKVKIGLAVFLAIGLMPIVSLPGEIGPAGLVPIVLREVIIGLSLGFAVRVLIAAAEFAGHLSAFQIGFSYGATIDPSTGVRNNIIANTYGMLAVFTFLAINGHHALLRALAVSYSGLPIGTGEVDASLVTMVRQMLALVFIVGVRLAAPIVVVVLFVEFVVGLISRTAPSLSALVIGFPLRIIIGLIALAFVIGTVPSVIGSMVERAVSLGLQTAAAFR